MSRTVTHLDSMSTPHVALLPSSGTGHLMPFLRLAAALLAKEVHVMLITAHPMVSEAENEALSSFLSAFDKVNSERLDLLRIDPEQSMATDDPFYRHIDLKVHSFGHISMSNCARGDMSGGPHIALFPSAGMGHLMPYLRLATVLLDRCCRITLITPCPTITTAEAVAISSFLSTYPEVNDLELRLVPDNNGPDPAITDPHFFQFARISRSTHLIRPMLSSASPPLSAVISDLSAASQVAPILTDLHLPLYILFTTSVKFLPLIALLPKLLSDPSRLNPSCSDVNFPGLPPLPDHRRLAPTTADRKSRELTSKGDYKTWLESQPVDSVVYVCFGSKAPMGVAQIQELGKGLVGSGFRFLWALKMKISLVDEYDDHDEETKSENVRELLGDSVWHENGRRGMVMKSWVDQDEVLASSSIGGFVSHCGWNSVTEAMWAGVPVLAWPHRGDQRVNAQVVEESGLGVWMKEWGMGTRSGLVNGEEIGEKIGEFMRDENLRERARKIGEEARKAVDAGGSSHETITKVLKSL
ncbi:UDP-glycosyltransferase 13-like [Punica granatum]|uniref:Glycosyltransferase n=2 Tax=Punica granatum TaxID=22663 RepID=A0A6P8EK75_PUNGR|nr:UDP-glycosyltransferase 13-like [Punica granatum]